MKRMRACFSHSWELSPREAQALQRELAARVRERPQAGRVAGLMAGVDLSPPDAEGVVRAAAATLRLPELELLEVRTARARPAMAYVPGLLSFREAPVILAALEKLELEPDVVLVDGHGRAHPRRFGIASHLGVLLECPVVGFAKSVLVGSYEEPGEEPGEWAPLVDRGEVVGAALRSRRGTRPVFVSVGHLVDLETAVRWVVAACNGYRLPEPARMAHQGAAGRLGEGFEVR